MPFSTACVLLTNLIGRSDSVKETLDAAFHPCVHSRSHRSTKHSNFSFLQLPLEFGDAARDFKTGAGAGATGGARAGTEGRAGAGWLSGDRRTAGLVRAARNAAAYRGTSGMTWREMVRQGRAMRRDSELSWGQVLMAANTPVLLRAAMVDGRTDLGLMSSGQVAGLIEDLPSCAELIEAIMREAEACLDTMATLRSAAKDVQT